ncbi:pulmonary surfactant-associated protein D-like [Anopheles stephensi]|uniref:pulmonary surfactant-associated protein D-like n=1 Tax=Anopheles stephensi TaxID=30069 RepID=UPI0016589AA2|nr:pulmonary surfactant-associated protein D-like [Anopheles stephensi]
MKTVLLVLAIVGLAATAQALHYTAYKTKVSFFEAWQQCIVKGGSLVSIETAYQNSMVLKTIKNAGADGGCWLSGTDIGLEGSWVWLSNNKPIGNVNGYVNFNVGEPNNAASGGEHCLTMNFDGSWNDEVCGRLLYYVCEFYTPL